MLVKFFLYLSDNYCCHERVAKRVDFIQTILNFDVYNKILIMVNKNGTGDLSEKMRIGFDKARLKLLEQEAKNDGSLIISDKDGNIKKVPATELLLAIQK